MERLSDFALDPPEDRRACVYRCAMCGGSILEGDDYYDFGALGIYCEECVDDSRRCCAELDDPIDYRRED